MNQLSNEKSAYLQQHKDNPVHWLPYNDESIAKAKELNKPIFLSVGYSSCHWCHVMAYESFSDEATAKYLNENFVSIKVDREEFPDIDQYYQKACYFFGRHGGWPLSTFLLPDMRPFYAGTYFPMQRKGEMPSFLELLMELKRAYEQDNETVVNNAVSATDFIENPQQPEGEIEVQGHFAHPSAVFDALKQYQDDTNGGYGKAPKFPTFTYWEWASEQMAEGMIQKPHQEFMVLSLDQMLLGGMYDQAKGGVHRYSTDDQYLVPHFEKMLYDQAGLLRMLAKLSLSYPAPHIYDSIIQTLDYLETEMRSDDGYLFSAQDADSEGSEGLYFTFSKEEFEDAINDAGLEEDMETLTKWFQITEEGNFENGLSVISLNRKLKADFMPPEAWQKVRDAKKALLESRRKRIPPMTDSKGVASWNFMLVSAIVDVVQYCRIEVIRKRAQHLLNAIVEGVHKTFVIPNKDDDKRTMIRHTTTKDVSLPYFEDYVFFSEMQLRLYEMSGNSSFKDNFNDCMNFIKKEFYQDDKFLTRASQANDSEGYGNIAVDVHDASFRSPLATYLELVRRYSVFFSDTSLEDSLSNFYAKTKQTVLRNPLSAGQGLRALTYPPQAYRVLKVPKAWAKDSKFSSFAGILLPRFVIKYIDASDAQWQVCTMTECQVQGKGIDEMIEKLSPQNPETNS